MKAQYFFRYFIPSSNIWSRYLKWHHAFLLLIFLYTWIQSYNIVGFRPFIYIKITILKRSSWFQFFFQNSRLIAFGHLLIGPIISIIFHHNVKIPRLVLFGLNGLIAVSRCRSMNECRVMRQVCCRGSRCCWFSTHAH